MRMGSRVACGASGNHAVQMMNHIIDALLLSCDSHRRSPEWLVAVRMTLTALCRMTDVTLPIIRQLA